MFYESINTAIIGYSELHYQSNWQTLKDSNGEIVLSPSRLYFTATGQFLQKDFLFPMTLLEQKGMYWNSIFNNKKRKNDAFSSANYGLYRTFNGNPYKYLDIFGNDSWIVKPQYKVIKDLPLGGTFGETFSSFSLTLTCVSICSANTLYITWWVFTNFDLVQKIQVRIWREFLLYEFVQGIENPENKMSLKRVLENEEDHVRDHKNLKDVQYSYGAFGWMSTTNLGWLSIVADGLRTRTFGDSQICLSTALSTLSQELQSMYTKMKVVSREKYDYKNGGKHQFDKEGAKLVIGTTEIILEEQKERSFDDLFEWTDD